MRRYLRIPTVFGTATGAQALKRVKFLLHELEKRYSLWMIKDTSIETVRKKHDCMVHLHNKKERFEKEKKAIIEKIEMIKANITDYGVLGKEYQIRN